VQTPKFTRRQNVFQAGLDLMGVGGCDLLRQRGGNQGYSIRAPELRNGKAAGILKVLQGDLDHFPACVMARLNPWMGVRTKTLLMTPACKISRFSDPMAG